jgi:hypothetical protein
MISPASSACGIARLPAVQPGEQQRVGDDRQQRAGQDQVVPLLRQHLLAEAKAGEDEGELADLRQAGRDGQRGQRCGSRTAHHR